MLIDPAQLRANLDQRDWVIFDCRHDLAASANPADPRGGLRRYREGHIPGAHFVPFERALVGEKTGRNGRHPLPEAIEFAAFLNEHGVTSDTRIVAYDDAGWAFAARLWWLARWIGLTNVAVLNGGLTKWLAEGHPLTAESSRPRLRGRVVARPAPGMVRCAADVQAGTAARRCLVIDARAPERYRGDAEPIDRVAGHIPTAVNRWYRANFNPDLTLRSAAELLREFAAVTDGWRPEQVVHHCGSGITACVNLLAMEYAGLCGSKLYAGSWSEWCCDPCRPVARG